MSIINLIITIILLGLVFYILFWLLGKVGLPEPFNKVALVLIALAAAIVLLSVLFGKLRLPAITL
jgi:hypothetical protein